MKAFAAQGPGSDLQSVVAVVGVVAVVVDAQCDVRTGCRVAAL